MDKHEFMKLFQAKAPGKHNTEIDNHLQIVKYTL